VTAALRICHSSLARNSKSFALAARLLPSAQRDHVAVVYAWCRRADDAIDLVPASQQPEQLRNLRRELGDIYAGKLMLDPTLTEFQRVVRECDIPEVYPRELLDGMAMDVEGYRYRTWDELLLYCYRVASTVGLMMCRVMSVEEEQALDHAVDLGIAMQLTNIARDVNEDWRRHRLYIPDTLLCEHGLPRLGEQLGHSLVPARERLRSVVRELVEVAERYYRSADLGLPFLTTRNALCVAAARLIYADIGRQLASNDYDVLAPRATVSFGRKLALLFKAMLRTYARSHGDIWVNEARPTGAEP
jgi:phytoene synthase